MSERFSLKWNSFKENFANSLSLLRQEDILYDVTLVSDDHKQISAHRLVLSASSEYFKEIFIKSKTQFQLMLCLDGVNANDLNNILQYIYNGEIQIFQDDLDRFLEISQRFKLQGLTGTENVSESRPKMEASQEEHCIGDDTRYLDQSFPIAEKEEGSVLNTNIGTISKSIYFISGDFNDIRELDNKIEENINRDVDGMFKCNICPKVNRNKGHMREHVESHIDGLSFPCHHCDKTFRSRNSLRKHSYVKHTTIQSESSSKYMRS